MTAVVTRRWVVSGQVQGVGFRWFVRREAELLGLGGWVRNLADGSVEVVAMGEPERLDRLAERVRQGPPHSRVSGFATGDVPQEGVDSKSFIIKH